MKYAQAAVLAASLSFAAVATADTFTVTNTADSGTGSLRDGITRANATPGDDVVRFSIPGVLTPATPYPATVGKVVIDGNAPPSARAVPVVEIDASALSAPAFRLSSGSQLGGLAIHGDHAAAVEAGDGAIVANCFIGTDVNGNSQIPNATGILVTGAGVRLISNLISGNTTGVEFTPTAGGSSMYDNRIGLSASGTYAIPNGVGVSVSGNASSAGLAIGILGIPNAISGNTGAAIRIASFNSVTITGNYIGVADYTGKAMGNGGNGIELSGSSHCSITENTIANNGGTAIWIGGGAGAQNHNLISKNTIARNGFGIDLGDARDGHTGNDSLDGDSGPNGLQNHPVITSAIENLIKEGTPTSTISGTLSSAPSSTYAVELYENTSCASGDYGSAETYLKTLSVTTDSSGNATFSTTVNWIPAGHGVAATATDGQNNTSELSNCGLVRTHGKFKFAAYIYDVYENTGSVTVTILRDGTAGTATVDYATIPAAIASYQTRATAGVDFANTSGTLTFLDGEGSKTFTIPLFDDNLYEPSEYVDLMLSNPTGGALLNDSLNSRVNIMNDDPTPKFSIANTSVTEGNSGTTYARFPVTLTNPAGFPITINLAAGCCSSATAGEDYQQITGSVTFAPGETAKTFDVPVFGDTKYEKDEVFYISLVSFSPEDQGITYSSGGATGTIVNDDIGKVVCTPSVSIAEGAAGTFPLVEINCTPDSPFSGGVYYLTANGTAGPDDYTFTSGSVVFNPGYGGQTFRVPITGDDTVEPNEQFTINLRAEPAEGWNFVVEPMSITVTILNDDTPGVVRCSDVFAYEGNSGSKDVTITCSSPTRVAGTIDYTTADGTATSANDYAKASGSITFDDETTKSFTVPIFGDRDVEPDEQFTINLTAHPSTRLPFTLARDSVLVTIQNDDQPPPAPTLLLAPARLAVNIGDTAQVRATIEPSASQPSTLVIVAQDSSIVGVPSAAVIAPGQPAFIPITAKKRGTTVVTISAGAETAAVLFVDVTEGSPSAASIEPSSGPTLGGAAVLLHGANLSSSCVAWFGGIQAMSSVVNNATTATIVAPPHVVGIVDVTLTCGSATVTLPQAFTYVPVRGRAARH
jgi:parallel beta-helix repeat protein